MQLTKTCPECCSQVPQQAEVCGACGRRIEGKPCPDCAELSKQAARKCRYCGHDFARTDRISVVEPYAARAAFPPTLLLRGHLIPQEIRLTQEKVVIRSWGFLWLSHTDEEIPWEKIAGYHYHSGWFWDRIEIQTRGQKANAIGGLRKSSGQRIKLMLERMKG